MSELKIVIYDKKAKVFTPYNPDFVRQIRQIGKASWNRAEGCWIIPSYAVDRARKIMTDVYGESDIIKSPKITLRITFLDGWCEHCSSIIIFAKTIARATGRDSGASPGDDVVVESGDIDSGGSAKNWATIVKQGTVVTVYNVSKNVYEKEINNKNYEGLLEIEVLEENNDIKKLVEEGEKLKLRLIEINSVLKKEGLNPFELKEGE